MASEDALCLENIDEFVHDENKIVTCKWLSLTLKIHINQAKRLLYTFLQQQRKKDKDVNATYFVAGLAKGDNGHMCIVVAETDLDAARSRLATVTSCHVYSVQRASLKDSNSLYMTDYEGVQENLADCNKYSSIHFQRAATLRSQPARKAAPSPAKPLNTGKDGLKPLNGSGADKSGSGEPQASKGKKPEPKGSIAAMFAQSIKNKEAGATKKKDSTAKEAAKENKPSTKKGSVMDLFANAKPAAKPKAAVEVTETAVPRGSKVTVTAVPTESEVTVTAVPRESKAAPRKGRTAPEVRSKKTRPKDDSDCDEQPDRKRRRRIKDDMFDSSSEEEIEIEDSPVPSPVKEPSPEPEPPAPVHKTPEKRHRETTPPKGDDPTKGSKRRRRRKLVPKTYLDEDGFMVTEKVWESESTDGSEVEEESRKKTAPQKKPEPVPSKKASPKKKTSPAKGKQTSLMSFFKKK